MDGNPWVDRFTPVWSDAELDRVITTPAGELPDLNTLTNSEAHAELLKAFKKLTVPSHQMREGLRRLLTHARTGAQELFPDWRSFLTRAYSKDPVSCSLPMICITSLAGCGKTALIEVLKRALPAISYADVPNHDRFRLVAGYSLTARAGVGLAQFLEPIFPEDVPPSRSIFSFARRQLARDGVAILIPDELQFVTQSKGAAQVTNLLLHVGALGPAVGYVTNFSLIHRLDRRPHEQRDRLLSDPLILVPDPVDSEDWNALLAAHFATHRTFAALAELPDHAVEMHLRTYAIKRNVPKLLALAYCAAREDGSATVHLRHLQRAYLSLSYASARNDVEFLLKSHITGFDRREDLWCPLKGENLFVPAVREIPQPRDRHAEALDKAALVNSLSAEEAKHLKAISKAQDMPTKPERQPRPKVTAATLAAGARAMASGKLRNGGAAT